MDEVVDDGDVSIAIGQAAADTRGQESALAADDVEAVGGMAAGLQLDAEVVAPCVDGVPDSPAVVVGQVGGVAGDHHAMPGVAPQVPERGPA
ncbi:hypothetical protein [Streptomyces sp. 135]|uniref:hypothetical protein n=1 Tax=Streptomyces sp. 135 TaxID=2838850 RepID=UPI001CBAE287|nr:hypothetical protein [Streptomyces sp. 135]